MSNILLVGIKGTGMSSLALILKKQGNFVFGIDSNQYFQPQEKLIESNILIIEEFSISNIDYKIDKVIYSTAYEKHQLVNELKKTYETYSYIEYISLLTKSTKAYGISGTHGKTTTCAATTYLLSYKERKAFPFFSIYGSSLIGKESFTYQGEKAFVLEACEYQNHFLKYSLNGAVITSIDFDHPDFFEDINSVRKSFNDFAKQLKPNSFLILNIDDSHIKSLKNEIEIVRNDINIITYGFYDNSNFRIQYDNYIKKYHINLINQDYFDFKYVDRAIVSDLLASAILSTCIILDADDIKLYLSNDDIICEEVFTTLFRISLKALETFPGVKGRLDVKAIEDNIVYIDDYAHHPTEIYSLINELRNRYPNKKLFAVFGAHTASRTKALYKEFLNVFLLFDKLIITKTFSSARMDYDKDDLSKKLVVDLNKKLLKSFKVRLNSAIYVEAENEISSICASMIEDGDVVITLGASNNDELYKEIICERNIIKR